jgi:hypothetical protein
MAEGLTNLATVAGTFGMSMESGASMAISGLQALGGMMEMVSQGAVTEIEHQIAMEQKRDGKSSESLAKIKTMEAKKIKEQRKAAMQSILISTAVAVMNAAANPWPLPAIPLMAAAAVAGGLALSQANSSSSNSLAQLNATSNVPTTSSVSVGSRDNSINVGNQASQGERAFVTGAKGFGSADNFTSRASGGRGTGNTSMLVGEFGPELITPIMDSTITSNEDLRESGSGSGSSVNYNVSISTMDAQSFLDNSANIFEAFSLEASQQGMAVDRLRD